VGVLEAGAGEREERGLRAIARSSIVARRELDLGLLGDEPPDRLDRLVNRVELGVRLESQPPDADPAGQPTTEEPDSIGLGAGR